MSAALATFALPAAALMTWALIRSPLGRRVVDRAPLARRDDERLQPARQHGRARGDDGGDRVRLLRRRRVDDPRQPARARPRPGRRARLRGLLAVQPAARQGRRGLHGRLGEPAARLRARRARPLGELEGGGDDGRGALPADPRPRGADPRHDARHDRPRPRGAADLPGRTRPHVAPARLPRALREARRAAPRPRHREHVPEAHLRRNAARAPRSTVRALHPLRPLPRRLALRGRAGGDGDDHGGRPLGARGLRVHHSESALGRLPAERLRRRLAALHDPRRCFSARRAGALPFSHRAEGPRGRAPHAPRGSRPRGPQPPARAARDAGRARRRLRRRRSAPAPPPSAGRPGPRRRRRHRVDPRDRAARPRPGDDPGRAARTARLRRLRLRAGRRDVPLRAAADGSRPTRHPRRVGRVTTVAVAAPARTRLERLSSALPILTVFAWLCLVYGVEAWLHGTPWLFTDELETAQLSRAIAATGHAARRGQPHPFGSLYNFLIAPAWWLHSVLDAYSTIKYLGVAVMTSVVFPAYWLARMVVSPRPALFAAAASAAIPAFLYAPMLLPEPLAYPYSALCLFLIAKALSTRGAWWIGALTIGLGVFPVVAGLSALVRPRGVVRTERERAFVAVAAASVAGFAWYTAIKAAYVSTVFSTLTEERNLIYVSPVLFVATALFLERPRVRLLPVAGAAALAGYVLVGTDYKMDVHLYNDAPGLSILQSANRNLGLTPHGARIVLLSVLAASVAVLLAPRVRRVPAWAVRGLVVTAALFVLAWNITGQMAAASASRNFSDELLHNYPRPLNWLDQDDHGEPAMYLGQQITDANGLWLLEFWNKSLHYVWSLDGTAKGPGPTLSPDLLAPDGRITDAPGIRYAVVDPGIDLVGRPVTSVEHHGGGAAQDWRLYRIVPPLRLVDAATGIYADGWAGEQSAYSRYRTPGDQPGFVVVNVSRAAWNGPAPPGHVTIRVGPLRVEDKQPALASVTQIRRWKVESGLERSFVIPTPKPPFRVEVLISPTFVPAQEDSHSSDVREFGAQVSFGFRPR